MTWVLALLAALVTVALVLVLLHLTGGRDLLYTHRTLTRPRSTTQRAPRRADR